jgi:hypothetical protein
MKYIYAIALFAILGCSSSKDENPAPKDPLVGTTWVRFGFKSPLNNKDVYYYLTFIDNNKVQNSMRYNKTEATGDVTTYSYTFNNSILALITPTETITGEVIDNKINLKAKAGVLVYTKEN